MLNGISYHNNPFNKHIYDIGLNTRKPVSGVSDKVIPKPACSATEEERSGFVGRVLDSTKDTGWSLTGVTVLCP